MGVDQAEAVVRQGGAGCGIELRHEVIDISIRPAIQKWCVDEWGKGRFHDPDLLECGLFNERPGRWSQPLEAFLKSLYIQDRDREGTETAMRTAGAAGDLPQQGG
jgi:hypothetical protein